MYSFPNIFIPFFGGYFIDKVGVRTCVVIFAGLVFTGHAVFCIGVSVRSYALAIIGRIIFGCGGENLCLSQTLIVVKWFSNTELLMALGLSIAFSRLGNVLSTLIGSIISNSVSLEFAVIVGVIACSISLAAVYYMNKLDKKRDDALSSIESSQDSADFDFAMIAKFKFIYWMLVLNSLAIYGSIYCYTFVSSNYFQLRFGYDSDEAGWIVSIVYGVGMISCPLVGLLSDQVGKKEFFLLISSGGVVMVHLLFLCTDDSYKPFSPIIYLVLLGLSYASFTTVVWGAISYVVPANALGTAFGINNVSTNLGLAVGPIIVGAIKDFTTKSHGYFWVSFFLFVLAGLGFLAAMIIFLVDMNGKSVLNFKHDNLLEHQDTESKSDETTPLTYQY